MLVIANDAIFIQTNMKKENLKNKKIEKGGGNDAHMDDKLLFIKGP